MKPIILLLILIAVAGCENKSFDEAYRESRAAQATVLRTLETEEKVDALDKEVKNNLVFSNIKVHAVCCTPSDKENCVECNHHSKEKYAVGCSCGWTDSTLSKCLDCSKSKRQELIEKCDEWIDLMEKAEEYKMNINTVGIAQIAQTYCLRASLEEK